MEQATAHPSAQSPTDRPDATVQAMGWDDLGLAIDQLEATLAKVAACRAGLRSSGALAAADQALGLKR